MLVMLSGWSVLAQTAGNVGAVNGPVITVESDSYDFGTIEEGANGDCEFVIKNTGNETLIISLCKGSCGCTVPQCPEEPIPPGGTAVIKVHYNTNKLGPITKKVMITSNAVNSNAENGTVYELYLKGNVKAKPVGGAPVNNNGVPTN